jgi:hypothetical protein
MLIFLQIWGGIFFLLNKIFLSKAERFEKKHVGQKSIWRIRSWTACLIGMPSWIFIFIKEHNWIATAIDLGGTPSIILALWIAIKGIGKQPKWLNYVAIASIILGLGYSFYEFHGITKLTQLAELVIGAGFLFGTYQLAKLQLSGYLWYIAMHIGCIMLMYLEGYPWLAVQQIVSIFFVVDAFWIKKTK